MLERKLQHDSVCQKTCFRYKSGKSGLNGLFKLCTDLCCNLVHPHRSGMSVLFVDVFQLNKNRPVMRCSSYSLRE